jgi:hypothetical protein
MGYNTDPDGNRTLVSMPRQGSEVIYATHDLTDETTWYTSSERVTGATLTDSGDGLTWDMPDSPIIDMVSGRILDTEALIQEQKDANPESPHGYEVKVYVDATEKTARGYYAASGGDYSINYAAGSVTFFSSQAGNTVTADYSRRGTSSKKSCWVIKPTSGKHLDIESAEAQFSDDIDYKDSVVFEVKGKVEIFAPELTPTPYPAGTLIPILTTKYHRLDQIIDEAMGSYPIIPAMGGSTRGNAKPRYGFPFRYGTIRRLTSSYGMELHVYLENDIAFTGERATATFYCTSKAE